MGEYLFETVKDKEVPLAEQVAEQIRQLIIDRQLTHGEKLPNEFELAQQLNVGRGTVREAVKLLVARNVLEIRRGRGSSNAGRFRTGWPERPAQAGKTSRDLNIHLHQDGILMKTGKLYGVGIGPGDPQYLTLRAADVLRSVDVVFTVISPNASNSVSQSVVDYLQPRGEVRLQVFSMSRDKTIREEQVRANAEAIIAELRAGHDCAFATLGDAMTYSTFGYVLEIIRKAIPNLDLEVIPGITSFATLTAKAGTVLVENGEQLRIIPSFRAEMAEALDFPKGSTTILLKSYRSRGALLDRLAREEKVQVLYGEHLAMKEQALLTDPDAIRARPEKYLSLIMVKKQ